MLASLDACFAGVRPYRNAAAIERDHATFLDEQLGWCTDHALAARRAAGIGTGTPADFLNRGLPVGDEHVLAGLRHFGGDPARPFVDLLAWTGRLDLRAALAATAEAWSAVAPPRARIAGPADDVRAPGPRAEALDRGDVPVTTDVRAVAGSLAEMLAAPPPRDLAGIELEDADVDEAVRFVAAGYAALAARAPELVDRVPPSDRDRLAACRADGRLVFWRAGGERAGLLAIERSTGWLALDGWLLEEEVAHPDWAGRGTAAAAQRRLAERLVANGEVPGLVLAGTIDVANGRSLTTARRAGRRPLAAWWFVPIAGRTDSPPTTVAEPGRVPPSPGPRASV